MAKNDRVPTDPECGYLTIGIDTHTVESAISANTTGEAANGFERVLLVEVDDLRSLFTGHFQAAGMASIAKIRPARNNLALAMANCPTGPHPNTATVLPG